MINQLRHLSGQYGKLKEPWRFLVFLAAGLPSLPLYYLNPIAGIGYLALLLVFRAIDRRKTNR